MKTLHDGTEVEDDVPTRNTGEGRFLLTQGEIDARQVEEAAWLESLEPTWDKVKEKQNQMFAEESETQKRFARYGRHLITPGKTPKESAAKFKEITDYYEAIEDANNDYATPEEAITALNALTEPTE